MLALLKKEIRSFFSSATALVVIAVFLVLSGSFLWILPGVNNVLDAAYANVDALFLLAPWLFLFLIPALSMRSFSEERRTGTMELLLTRPIQNHVIVLSKYFACLFLVFFALLLTLIYLFTISWLGLPAGNVDYGAYWGSFLGLLLLASVYVSIGIFSSSITDNQIISFVLSAFLSFFMYAGVDMFAVLLTDVYLQDVVSSLGIAYHYESMSRGVIDSRDVFYLVSISFLFLYVANASLSVNKKKILLLFPIISLLILLNILSSFVFFRLDLSSEKRFSLSDNTITLLEEQQETLKVSVYMGEDLNMGFLQLKKATNDILEEFNVYAKEGVVSQFIDPSTASSQEIRNKTYQALEKRGMKPSMVYDKDENGNRFQKIIFPWAECIQGKDTVLVNLLKNVPGTSGEENLNLSIESLEYELTDAIRILSSKYPLKVAFLEGHGEMQETDVYDITTALAKYYQVDRGQLGNQVGVLNAYKVVIVAAPYEKYTEAEKFILDQYLMQGGRILFLLDGVRVEKELAILNETNLDDMLFTYGLRISPVLLMDAQSTLVPINVSPVGEEPKFEPSPWYYSPLLLPSPQHVITRNIAQVKANFSSALEFVENAAIKKEVLLVTSAKTGVERLPAPIRMDVINLSKDSPFFANSYLPIAATLEGRFTSVFSHRMLPKEIINNGYKRSDVSVSTKIVVVANGEIIRNEVEGYGVEAKVMPLGYDRYMNKQFGNKDFILNAVNYLADDEGWMELRGRELKLRLLNKEQIRQTSTFWKVLNVGFPLLLLIIFSIGYQVLRKKRYN